MDPSRKAAFGLAPDLDPSARAFRVLLLTGQRLHSLMDERLRPDGLTTQQAALLTVVKAMDAPSVTEAARALRTTHQNAAQLVASLTRKNFLRTEPDPAVARARHWQSKPEEGVNWRPVARAEAFTPAAVLISMHRQTPGAAAWFESGTGRGNAG